MFWCAASRERKLKTNYGTYTTPSILRVASIVSLGKKTVNSFRVEPYLQLVVFCPTFGISYVLYQLYTLKGKCAQLIINPQRIPLTWLNRIQVVCFLRSTMHIAGYMVITMQVSRRWFAIFCLPPLTGYAIPFHGSLAHRWKCAHGARCHIHVCMGHSKHVFSTLGSI